MKTNGNKVPNDVRTFVTEPMRVNAVEFREELADGYSYICSTDSVKCRYYESRYCYKRAKLQESAPDCPRATKQFYIYQGGHALDFGYPEPGDYIEYLDDGRKKVWLKEQFNERFKEAPQHNNKGGENE